MSEVIARVVTIDNDQISCELVADLVRCKDCKHYTANVYKNNGFNYGECHKLAIGLGVYAVEDWYCADGERRTDCT